MTESPYLFTRSEGNVHIRLAAAPKRCIACVRQDAYLIIEQETRRQVLAEVRAAVERNTVGGTR